MARTKKSQPASALEPQWPIGTVIRKKFPPNPAINFQGGWFVGEVTEFSHETGFYLIVYEDGDQEEFVAKDMKRWIQKDDEDKKKPAAKRLRNDDDDVDSSSPPSKGKSGQAKKDDREEEEEEAPETLAGRYSRRKRTKVNYQELAVLEDSDDDMSIVEEEDTKKPVARSKRGGSRRPATKRTKKNDEEEFSEASLEDSSSEDELEDLEEEEEEEEVVVAKKKKGRKAPAKAPAKAKPAGRKTMAESFKPLNNPLFWTQSLTTIQEEHEYLDACGMEATDDVIDNLVGEQVLKVGKLLERALKDPDTIGSSKKPFQLGTVCSGTDSPALALTMVQEQLKRFQLPCKLHVEHLISCEKEPFKQSYLARNFNSILYPDVVKLTESSAPFDVFGRPTKIPKMNALVAGTSCKNFSMLVSTRRLDIEDKGCSGETFLATVELLFQERPLISVFENVTGAPWAKMAEYITGRVPLGTINDPKGINNSAATSKEKSIKQLMFEVNENNKIVVTEVPMNIGVRCGTIVKGFLRENNGKDRQVVHPAKLPSKKTFSLDDLLQANKGAGIDVSKKSKDMLVFDTPCTFCTATLKVDTKIYGLPQTRERTYMFVWQPDDPTNYNDDLGEYWHAIFKYLKSPVKHSLENFILDDDHDNIRVFREALRGPSGRHTKRSIFQEPDFYTSGNANVTHNVTCREKSGMDMHARPNMRAGPFGAKQIAPHFWLEYFDLMPQRELDMMDILHIAAARDAECHDGNFASFFWNVSQNVSKEKHRTKTPGIAGCISPGGEFICPNLGRPLLGCEKLLLQGIPYFRLALGSETEVELGDLAGNAMSLTVVCAAQIAAVLAPQLRREFQSTSKTTTICAYLEKYCAMPAQKEIILPKEPPTFESSKNAHGIFWSLAKMADEAVKTSVWCTCETSGRNSESLTFIECSVCRVSVCSNCLSSHNGYQMESHRENCREIHLAPSEHHVGTFLSKLRHEAPSTLVFGKDGINAIAELTGDYFKVKDLWRLVFNLQKIKRHRKKWTIYYNARDNGGVGQVVAEFRVCIGELRRQVTRGDDAALGLKGELRSYFPAKVPPLRRGKIEPCAVVVVDKESPGQIKWLAKTTANDVSVKISGFEPESSYRAELGLNEQAQQSLEANSKGAQAKHFVAAKARGEAARWVYPKNWQKWPKTIVVVSDDAPGVSGEYRRAACRQTTNQSALWICESRNDNRYLIIRPNVGRTGPDVAIVSRSIDHDDDASILLQLPPTWQPCHALNENLTENQARELRWEDLSDVITCTAPTASLSVETTSCLPEFISIKGLTDAQISMIYPFESNEEGKQIDLPIYGGERSQKVLRAFDYICVPPMVRSIAQNEALSTDLSPKAAWNELLPAARKTCFGYGNDIIPRQPTEEWYYDGEREAWARRSIPEESRRYFVLLKQARKAFEFALKRSDGQISVRCFPEVAAHHAVQFLVEGRPIQHPEKEIAVSYRLSDTARQADPQFSPFKVSPCTNESQTEVKLKDPFVLYDRQKKVVTKMSMIESGKVPFEELEMSEHEMPGSTGISVIARATRERSISGGVIADAIGAGKTVISIAMILKGLDSSRRSRQYPRCTGATAVAVPSALVGQWKDEIDKFTTGLEVLCIRDTNDLFEASVAQIIEADVVIFPVDIIEPKAYTDNLVAKSTEKNSNSENPSLPKAMSNSEKAGAKGVWIPAASRDPYGQGSANEMKNQKLRDISAYFTHSYLKSIQALRKKEFKRTDTGVPLEYFEWERIIVDEIHECLCTEKDNLQLDWFKEKNRRASRELLGITQKDVHQRPLVYRKSIFGLTGTPLLDNSSRVIELANLIGCTYVIGLASHWRKLERESSRDIFLQRYLEPKQSREIRQAIYSKCQEYLDVACCRNTTEKELEGITLIPKTVTRKMEDEEAEEYIMSQQGIPKKGFAVRPENFDPSAGHDISKFLQQNANSISRGRALVDTCREILKEHPGTKIIVFCDGRINAGKFASKYLEDSRLGCTWLQANDSVEEQNRKISYYQRPDSTAEDKARPRVLVLHFDHAAGLNLQKESNHLILYSPLYVGDGGITGDAVADASTEQQAIGRVFRPGQRQKNVFVYRLALEGPLGEKCLDDYLIRRNTDEATLAATTNAG